MTHTRSGLPADPFADIKEATLSHLSRHGCGCYPYSDGQRLATLAREAGAATVVELGTALGYSAAWFASTGAHVHTIDRDPTHTAAARLHLQHHRLADRVTLTTGEGAHILATLAPESTDIAFFDGFAPTRNDVDALSRVLRPGGLLIAANMTLAGQAAAVRRDLSAWHHIDLGETLLATKP